MYTIFIRLVKIERLYESGPQTQSLVHAHKNDFQIPKTDMHVCTNYLQNIYVVLVKIYNGEGP